MSAPAPCVAPGCQRAAKTGPFCGPHAAAPPGQRGGWISAAKRKPLNANAVAPRLWMGARPPFDRDLPQVDVLVLCAEELQPAELGFQRSLLRCPIPDGTLTDEQQAGVVLTALAVARAVAKGERALVTCAQGLNRSGLVVALSLGILTTMSGDQVIAHIRKHRGPKALGNPVFRSLIRTIVGDGRAYAARRPRASVE